MIIIIPSSPPLFPTIIHTTYFVNHPKILFSNASAVAQRTVSKNGDCSETAARRNIGIL